MRNIFSSFEAHRLEYLVIGGQAAILYGASQFTEDLDIWIQPSMRAIEALLRALADLEARVHKLTPPLTYGYARRGHGFHFVVPQRGEPDVYLDVMARPPRVRSFGVARARAATLETPWGRLAV